MLYEHRNVEPVLRALERVAPAAFVALAGRPYEADFLQAVPHEQVAERVVRIRFDDADPAGKTRRPA